MTNREYNTLNYSPDISTDNNKKQIHVSGQYYSNNEYEEIPIWKQNEYLKDYIVPGIINEIDVEIEKITSDKELYNLKAPQLLEKIFNIGSLSTSERNDVALHEASHGILGIVGDLATKRMTIELYEKTIGVIDDNQALLHQLDNAGVGRYSSILLSMLNASKISAEDTTENAMKYLVRYNMPIDTVKSLISSRIEYYHSYLLNTIYQRMNILTNYLESGIHTVTAGIYQAKAMMLNPLYEWVSKLPSLSPAGNDILHTILDEAERMAYEGTSKLEDLLKINVIEEELYKRRQTAMAQVADFYNIQNILERINSFELGDLVKKEVQTSENNTLTERGIG